MATDLQTRDWSDAHYRVFEGENLARQAVIRVAVVGNLDAHDSVFYPSAFAGTEKDFVKSGHVLVGHDDRQPNYGYILDARLEGRDFLAHVQFYDTQAGNDMYNVLRERMAAGKTMGASVGFFIGDDATFRSGSALLDDARARGEEMSLFDPNLANVNTGVWGIRTVRKVAEVSLVVAPSNPLADVVGVRALRAGEELRAALEAVRRVTERYEEIREMRKSEGRHLSPERLAELAAVRASIGALDQQLLRLVADAELPRATQRTIESVAPRALSLRIMAAEIDAKLSSYTN